jgi:hypothetical protein
VAEWPDRILRPAVAVVGTMRLRAMKEVESYQ